jgi:DNA-binding NarL/FixJ family response regulator
MSAGHVRVLVSEDDLIVREGIQNLIDGMDGVDVVDAVGDLPAAEEAVERLRPDVVVTDIRMPPTFTDEGLRLASMLRETHPEIGVVVLTQHADADYARTLLGGGSGGRAYLLKEGVTNRGQLDAAIRAVSRGESHVDSAIVERVLAEAGVRAADRLDVLTPREIQVLGMIAEAKSNDAVAQELGISTRAVERHVNAIFSRLRIDESTTVSRRVMAVLVYLEGQRRRESSGQADSD